MATGPSSGHSIRIPSIDHLSQYPELDAQEDGVVEVHFGELHICTQRLFDFLIDGLLGKGGDHGGLANSGSGPDHGDPELALLLEAVAYTEDRRSLLKLMDGGWAVGGAFADVVVAEALEVGALHWVGVPTELGHGRALGRLHEFQWGLLLARV